MTLMATEQMQRTILLIDADTSSMPTGVVITASTDSNDGDGLADSDEIQTHGTDPNDC